MTTVNHHQTSKGTAIYNWIQAILLFFLFGLLLTLLLINYTSTSVDEYKFEEFLIPSKLDPSIPKGTEIEFVLLIDSEHSFKGEVTKLFLEVVQEFDQVDWDCIHKVADLVYKLNGINGVRIVVTRFEQELDIPTDSISITKWRT